MQIQLKSILLLFLSLFFCLQLTAQYDFQFIDFDSVKVYKYKGMVNVYPIPLPPVPLPSNAKRSVRKKHKLYLKKYKLEQEKLEEGKVKIDTSIYFSHRSNITIDKKGKFNHSIKWDEGVKLDSIQIQELDSILSGKKTEFNYRVTTAMCYNPRHTVFLYEEGKVERHFDICFECRRIRLDGDRQKPIDVHFEFLYDFFDRIGLIEKKN